MKTIEEANDDFDDAVESNQSAILIHSLGDGLFGFEGNVRADSDMTATIYVQGFLLRYRSTYSVEFVSFDLPQSLPTIIDLDLISTISDFRQVRFDGLTGFTTTELANGFNIQFEEDLPPEFSSSLNYQLNSQDTGALKGYSKNSNENFFLYQLAPEIYTQEDISPRNYVFVIDQSGSMNGERMGNAKAAFNEVILSLNDQDYFNVLAFETNVTSLWESSFQATTENLNEATTWVNDLIASGGTNLEAGIREGLLSLDNEINAAKSLTVLSDGVPTEGVTDEEVIRENARTNNNVDAQIFTVALGNNADEGLMESIAYDSGGNYIQIDDDDVVDSLIDFYGDFANPITTGIDIELDNAYRVYPEVSTLTNPIFNGTEVLIVGKFNNQLNATASLHYSAGSVSESVLLDTTETSETANHIEFIWAIYAINNLLVNYAFDASDPIREEIIELALDYQILVEDFTSMILVVEDTTSSTTEQNTRTNPAEPPIADLVNTIDGEAGFSIFGLVLSFLLLPLLPKIRKK